MPLSQMGQGLSHFYLRCFVFFFLSPSVYVCVHVCVCLGVGVCMLLPLVKVISVKAADLATSSSRHQPKKSHGQSRGSTFLPSFSPASSPLRLLRHLHPQSTHSRMPCVLPECRHAISPSQIFAFFSPVCHQSPVPSCCNFLVRSPSRCFCSSIIQIVFVLL